MYKWKVPIQSLIDHIKTAMDVDPWAKEMAEELLKMHEPKHVEVTEQIFSIKRGHCPKCGIVMWNDTYPHWCGYCGQAVMWNDK